MYRILAFLCLCLLSAAPTLAATAIGKVSRIQGEAMGTVEGTTKPLALNQAVYLDETVATATDARLELTFDDQSVLTLGERASLRLDAFVYRPDARTMKVTLAGAFRFVSGAVSPAVIRNETVTTPFAVIAVRGTDFWGGPIDGTFGVLLFDGAVSVSNAGATNNLSTPGDGVTMDTAATPPGPLVVWAADKVDRAIATVTFR